MARKLKGDCGAREVGEFCGWVSLNAERKGKRRGTQRLKNDSVVTLRLKPLMQK